MNDTPTRRTNALLGKILYDCGVLDDDTAPEEWVQLARQLERERDEWEAKFIQQNKDLGCELMDPNGTIWDYAKRLQDEIRAMKGILLRISNPARGSADESADIGTYVSEINATWSFEDLTE